MKQKKVVLTGLLAFSIAASLMGCERVIVVKVEEEKSYEERCIVELSDGPVDLCNIPVP